MSDEPLKSQLEDVAKVLLGEWGNPMRNLLSEVIASRQWPLVEAALSATRQQTAEQIATKIETLMTETQPIYEDCDPVDPDLAEVGKPCLGTWGCDPWDSCEGQHYNGVSVRMTTREEYAAVARGVGETP